MAIKPRLVRADDFVAESIEGLAKNMPSDQQKIWLGMAQRFRESGRTNMVRIWEEEAGTAADFIRPDKASIPQGPEDGD